MPFAIILNFPPDCHHMGLSWIPHLDHPDNPPSALYYIPLSSTLRERV